MRAPVHYCPSCLSAMDFCGTSKNIITKILETTMKLLTRRSALRRLCALPAAAALGGGFPLIARAADPTFPGWLGSTMTKLTRESMCPLN